jgi:hypothetical protein
MNNEKRKNEVQYQLGLAIDFLEFAVACDSCGLPTRSD